jgi:hypothetical protein
MDAIEGGGWGVYSLQPLPSRWLFLLAMGTPDSPVVHRTRQHTHWGLEQSVVEVVCPVVSPDSLVPHQTCPVHSDFSALTSNLHCSLWQSTVGAMLPLLRWHTGHVPVHTGQSGEL